MSKSFAKSVPEPAGGSRLSSFDITPLETRWEMMRMLQLNRYHNDSIDNGDSNSDNETEEDALGKCFNMDDYLVGRESCPRDRIINREDYIREHFHQQKIMRDASIRRILARRRGEMPTYKPGVCAHCQKDLGMRYLAAGGSLPVLNRGVKESDPDSGN